MAIGAQALVDANDSTSNESKDTVLCYNRPATRRETEALPVGNGRLGAMVFGGVARERVQFNEDSLWTGDDCPTGDYGKMGAYQMVRRTPRQAGNLGTAIAQGGCHRKILADLRQRHAGWRPIHVGIERLQRRPELVDARPARERAPFAERGETKTYAVRQPKAFRLYRLTFAPNTDVRHFQVAEIHPVGVQVAVGSGPQEGYRRELDLATAVASAEFTKDGVRHRREVFASHPAQVLVIRWTADKRGAMSGAVQLQGAHGETSIAGGSTLSFHGALENGLNYEAAVRVVVQGGTVETAGDSLQLNKCDAATLLLAAGTDYSMDAAKRFRGANPHERLIEQLDAAAAKPHEELKREHLADYQQGLLTHNILPNLFANHPPFQMDGNFGITAGVCEMLLQSKPGEVELFPALPAAWKTGSVRGLRARGNVTVDVRWKEGKVTSYRITSPSPCEVQVRVGGAVTTVTAEKP